MTKNKTYFGTNLITELLNQFLPNITLLLIEFAWLMPKYWLNLKIKIFECIRIAESDNDCSKDGRRARTQIQDRE